MKIVLTESQYKLLLTEDRVVYLRGQNVANDNQIEKFQRSLMDKRNISDIPNRELKPGDEEPKQKGPQITAIQGEGGVDLAYVVRKGKKTQVKLTEPTFQIFVDADPSQNKQYIQWILDVFKKHALHDAEEASRFVVEDMDQATEALDLFHCIKERKKFRLNAPSRPGAPQNPKDIRQYESVGQLYGVVSGFDCAEEDDEGEEGQDTGGLSKKGYKLFKDLMGYAKLGQAQIHKLSDRVLIYQPQSLQSSCEPLGSLANWCTRATPTGGIERETGSEWFHKYRGATGEKSRLRPTGELSDYYVIMPIEIFQAERPNDVPHYPYQFHFESNQLHDKTNRSIGDSGISKLISEYPEVGEFFKKELGKWAAVSIRSGSGLLENFYIKYLNKFGGKVEDYVPKDAYDEGVESIKRLAKENRGPVANNKYLQWLLSNVEGTDIVDYIPLDIEDLIFNGVSMGQLPDLSMFENVNQMFANNCNLNTMPSGDKLPPNATIVSLSNNNIQEATFENYDKLERLMVVNLFDNPLRTVNTENLYKVLEIGNIARVALKNVSELENYAEYTAMIERLDREHPEHFIYLAEE